MILRGILSIYGGLVPLGFTHSNYAVAFYAVVCSVYSLAHNYGLCN